MVNQKNIPRSDNSNPNNSLLIAPIPELMGYGHFSDELLDALPDARPILLLDQWNGGNNPNSRPTAVNQVAEEIVVIRQEADQEMADKDSTSDSDGKSH